MPALETRNNSHNRCVRVTSAAAARPAGVSRTLWSSRSIKPPDLSTAEPPIEPAATPRALGDELRLVDLRSLRQLRLAQFVQRAEQMLADNSQPQPQFGDGAGHDALLRSKQQREQEERGRGEHDQRPGRHAAPAAAELLRRSTEPLGWQRRGQERADDPGRRAGNRPRAPASGRRRLVQNRAPRRAG